MALQHLSAKDSEKPWRLGVLAVRILRRTVVPILLPAMPISLCLLGFAAASASDGKITGMVRSSAGNPVVKATVILTSQAGSLQLETETDSSGRYRFEGLAPAAYALEARAPGFLPASRETIRINPDGITEIDFQLQLEKTTLSEAEQRGTQERNPNIFIRLVDLNALRDPLRRRGIEPEFLEFQSLENHYGSDLGAPIRQLLFVRPESPEDSLHGSVFESHQNSALNARPFFNVGPLRPSRRNQFGFSVGGPLAGPGLSFFNNLEFVRESGFVNGNIRVPFLDERIPLASDRETRDTVAALLTAFPAEDPNLPNVAPRQLNTNAERRIESADWNFRVDYLVDPDHKLAFRYTLLDYSEDPFEFVIGGNPRTELRSQSFSGTHVYQSSASTTLLSSFYFDRLAAQLLLTERFQNLLSPLGLQEAPDIGFGGKFADVSAIGPGSQFPRRRFQNRFSGNVDFSHQSSRHIFHVGGRTTRVQVNDLQSDNSRGQFTFSNNFGRTALENFLHGTPTQFTFTLGDLFRGFRNWEQALYLQDTFQARPNLTFNLGLRYEIVTAPSEVNGRTEIPYDTDANNFAPQIGFAWAPGGGRTVVRGGYGISYGHIYPGTFQMARFNPPAVRTFTVQNPPLIDPLGDFEVDPGEQQQPELNLLSPDLVASYSHQYNLSVERRLPGNLFFRAGYIGHRTFKPLFSHISNRARPVEGIPTTTATIDERRPDPRFGRILTVMNSGIFYYDGLKVSLSRTLARDLTFNVDYIFSKALTSTSDFASTGNREIGLAVSQTAENFQADLKGHSPFDHRHAVIFRYFYRLPDPSDGGGFVSKIFNGWSISGVTDLRTGLWFGIETSSDAPGFGNVDGEGGDRVNLLNFDLLGRAFNDPDTAPQILRPELFNSNLPPGGRGNEPVMAFRRNTINNTNLSLSKDFLLPIRESSLQFRAEFLNLFNHPLFDRPGDVFPSEIFGKIVDTQNKGRVIQFSLRLRF